MRHFFRYKTSLNCQSLAIHAIIKTGLIVRTLPFGQAAKKWLDLVMIDYWMNAKSGGKGCEKLRRIYRLPIPLPKSRR